MGVLLDSIGEGRVGGILLGVSGRSEAHEILELSLNLIVFELDLAKLGPDILVIVQKTLFLLIADPHLINEELSSRLLVITLLHPSHPLVALHQFSLVLMNNLLKLLPLPLKLKVMSIDFLLEI